MSCNKCKENEMTLLSGVLKELKRILTLISIWLCFIIFLYFLIFTICGIGLMRRKGCYDLASTRRCLNVALLLASAVDGGPAIEQYCINVLCLLGAQSCQQHVVTVYR